MEKSIDMQALEFRVNLMNLISNAQLPPSLVFYIVKDIYHMTEKEYDKILENYIGFIPADENKVSVIGGNEESNKSEE